MELQVEFVDHQHVVIKDFNESSDPVENILVLDGKSAQVLLDLLIKDAFFKTAFQNHHKRLDCFKLEISSEPLQSHIDYKTGVLVSHKLWEQIELEDALHWLSTLGGAYSNLGERSLDFAKKAGSNAFKQMTIAMKSQDPLVICKCWLFVAMSLMQLKQLKRAKVVIQNVHQQVKINHDADKTLLSMCLGIWSRLKYAWKMK